MEKLADYIHQDREIMSGMPVFKGTRVPVKNWTDYLATGSSIEDFLEDFPSVTREMLLGTIRCASEWAGADAHCAR